MLVKTVKLFLITVCFIGIALFVIYLALGYCQVFGSCTPFAVEPLPPGYSNN